MFDVYTISARSRCVCYIRFLILPTGWLQNYSSSTPHTRYRHQIQSKTEMSYAVIQQYSQEYFKPKISRKIRILFKKGCIQKKYRENWGHNYIYSYSVIIFQSLKLKIRAWFFVFSERFFFSSVIDAVLLRTWHSSHFKWFLFPFFIPAYSRHSWGIGQSLFAICVISTYACDSVSDDQAKNIRSVYWKSITR